LTFRLAGEPDVPAIVGLVESAYRGESSRAGWTTEEDLLEGQRTDAEAVLAVVRAPGSAMLLAEAGGTLAGSCQLERRPGGEVYLGMFSVPPGGQGQGRGREILAEAERLAREEWGGRTMVMSVLAQRGELIAWYERRGYRRTGETRPFPYGDARFGIPKRPDLHFVVLAKVLLPGSPAHCRSRAMVSSSMFSSSANRASGSPKITSPAPTASGAVCAPISTFAERIASPAATGSLRSPAAGPARCPPPISRRRSRSTSG
jgi:ribosomal protein S18 acetylase RimI-like enzyme